MQKSLHSFDISLQNILNNFINYRKRIFEIAKDKMDVSKMLKKKVLKKKKSKKDFRQPDDEDENQPKEVKAWWVSKEEQRPQTIENASTDYSNISLSFLTKQPQ